MTETQDGGVLPDVMVLKEGPLSMSVCSALDGPTTEAQVGPSGTRNGWTLVTRPFADGAPSGVECERYPGRHHYLFEC